MRIRFKAWARPELEASSFYVLEPEKIKGKCNVTVSTSTFVPKPHTPFEWCAQNTLDKIE